MKKKPLKSKAETVTFVLKSEKEYQYLYPLKNGEILKFPNKDFPTETIKIIPNQLTLF
jgi:hypothetical protein